MAVRFFMAFTILMVAMFLHLLTKDRPGRLFTMPIENAEAERPRARRVRVFSWIVAFIGAAIALAVPSALAVTPVVLISTLLPALFMTAEMMRAVQKNPLPPVPSKFIVPLGGGPRWRDLISPPLQALNGAVIISSALAFAALLPALPAEVPVHFNAAGQVDRMSSPHEHWIMLGMMLLITGMITGISVVTSRSRWVLPAKDGEKYAELELERRRLNVRMVERIMITLNIGFALSWAALSLCTLFGRAQDAVMYILMIESFSTLAVFAAAGTMIGRVSDLSEEISKMGHALGTHPSGWKWGGMVYFAPEDRALVVPKRSGVGQTVNFGRPSAWFLLAIPIAIPLAIAIISIV